MRRAHLDDRETSVLPLQPLDVRRQLQGLLVVAVADASVHELRDLQDLQDLRVAVQREAVHPPARSNFLRLLHEAPADNVQQHHVGSAQEPNQADT